ncbi:RNase RNM [Thalassotalea crassostreae]|uniref:RNase RNM n=1 Tax=Thalassotalea crassostreae TaxID=1763536 RepID=UPI000839330E|nr:PHP domain-containing protein [Thalassotalea crassostreae]
MSTLSDENKTNNYNSLRIDLHSHTTCSDGHLSPQELVSRAENYQIEQFAITDHDTVDAFSIAQQHIDEQNFKLRLISGIEISTMWENFEIHIVGLNIDTEHPALTTLIEQQQNAREQRAQLMAEKLTKAGFENCYEDAKLLAHQGTITRAHFARVLHNRGVVSTMQKAFDKYIGKGKRAYVKPQWCSIEQAILVIHQAGGKSVIAHPMKYDLSNKWLRRLIVDFSDAGGDAMEVASPQMNEQQRLFLRQLLVEYQLQGSVGSDFHFPSRWSDLGKNLTLPDDVDVVWQHWQ